jgi:hypothetical protein
MPGTVTTALAVVGAGAVAGAGLACANAGSSNIHNAAAVKVDAMKAAGRARVKSDFGTVNFSGLTAFDYRMKSGRFFRPYRLVKAARGLACSLH